MKYKIGVEDNLRNVREILYHNGYDVLNLDNDPELSEVTHEELDAIVVTGQNTNVAGIETIRSKAPVINAQGRTPEEVLQEVKNKIELARG